MCIILSVRRIIGKFGAKLQHRKADVNTFLIYSHFIAQKSALQRNFFHCIANFRLSVMQQSSDCIKIFAYRAKSNR